MCSYNDCDSNFQMDEEYRLRLQVALKRVVVIMCLFTIGLFVSAWAAKSLLLASTAVHMLIDIGTYACNLWANTHALQRFEELRQDKTPTVSKSYIMSAEVNAAILSRCACRCCGCFQMATRMTSLLPLQRRNYFLRGRSDC